MGKGWRMALELGRGWSSVLGTRSSWNGTPPVDLGPEHAPRIQSTPGEPRNSLSQSQNPPPSSELGIAPFSFFLVPKPPPPPPPRSPSAAAVSSPSLCPSVPPSLCPGAQPAGPDLPVTRVQSVSGDEEKHKNL